MKFKPSSSKVRQRPGREMPDTLRALEERTAQVAATRGNVETEVLDSFLDAAELWADRAVLRERAQNSRAEAYVLAVVPDAPPLEKGRWYCCEGAGKVDGKRRFIFVVAEEPETCAAFAAGFETGLAHVIAKIRAAGAVEDEGT